MKQREEVVKMEANKTGLVLGFFLGSIHLLWAFLVALGLAQPLLDFVYSIHFLSNPFRVSHFDLTTAIILVLVTFGVGYLAGYLLAFLGRLLKVGGGDGR